MNPEHFPRFVAGELRLPHYTLFLEPGAGMASSWDYSSDSWSVRLVYTPTRERRFELANGDTLIIGSEEVDDPATWQGREPLLIAIGDPGESRETVEAVFLEALCERWCATVNRLHGHRRIDHDGQPALEQQGNGIFGGSNLVDVWRGQVTLDYDLLAMVRAAESRVGVDAQHDPVAVSMRTQMLFWENKYPLRNYTTHEMPVEREYFSTQIPAWRQQEKECADDIFTGRRGRSIF